ncbi:MAG: DNA alkylation repair protein [Chitinophagales bacterium]
MTASEIMKQLEKMGDAQIKKTFLRHGATEPLFGVKIAELKTILKKTKKNHALSLELYKTGNSDAMYLAGLMADETKITEADLNEWVKKANWSYLNEFAVPWVAAETNFGFDLGMKWIKSDDPLIATAGWSTLSNFASVKADEQLNIEQYSHLLDQVEKTIHKSPNRVRYAMNSFVIAVGSYIKDLNKKALSIAAKISDVTVDMQGTACKLPAATDYIKKVIDKGNLGKKKKMARC